MLRDAYLCKQAQGTVKNLAFCTRARPASFEYEYENHFIEYE
jgi:hypothetical protein